MECSAENTLFIILSEHHRYLQRFTNKPGDSTYDVTRYLSTIGEDISGTLHLPGAWAELASTCPPGPAYCCMGSLSFAE